jgi:hypothetical protein
MAATKSPTPLDLAQTAQEQALAAIRSSQAIAVDTVGAWAKAVEKSKTQLPALPELPDLPTLEQIIASSFDFASELLDAQRQFTENLVAAVAPAAKTKAAA